MFERKLIVKFYEKYTSEKYTLIRHLSPNFSFSISHPFHIQLPNLGTSSNGFSLSKPRIDRKYNIISSNSREKTTSLEIGYNFGTSQQRKCGNERQDWDPSDTGAERTIIHQDTAAFNINDWPTIPSRLIDARDGTRSLQFQGLLARCTECEAGPRLNVRSSVISSRSSPTASSIRLILSVHLRFPYYVNDHRLLSSRDLEFCFSFVHVHAAVVRHLTWSIALKMMVS